MVFQVSFPIKFENYTLYTISPFPHKFFSSICSEFLIIYLNRQVFEWRPRADSNRRIEVLQTPALPLGYVARTANKKRDKLLRTSIITKRFIKIKDVPGAKKAGYRPFYYKISIVVYLTPHSFACSLVSIQISARYQ